MIVVGKQQLIICRNA